MLHCVKCTWCLRSDSRHKLFFSFSFLTWSLFQEFWKQMMESRGTHPGDKKPTQTNDTTVGAPIPIHVPHFIIVYQWCTFSFQNVLHWYMMMEWGIRRGMGTHTLIYMWRTRIQVPHYGSTNMCTKEWGVKLCSIEFSKKLMWVGGVLFAEVRSSQPICLSRVDS